MHDLRPITPLGRMEAAVEAVGSVTLTEIIDRALASVAAPPGREADTAALLHSFVQDTPPAPARHGGKTVQAFWIGPNQWMVDAPLDTHEDLAAQLVSAANGAAYVTEQTDAWCRFDLEGPGLCDVFERLSNADVRAFEGGEAVRTSIDHMGCFLICRTITHLSVMGPRSSAGSLHHALVTAIRSAM